MGFWGMLFNANKFNADPVQQRLAQLLIEGAEGPMGSATIRSFVLQQNWSRSEEENRIIHAVSMVRVWRPDLYDEVKRIGREHIEWSSAS